ncbi:MAG: DUF2378 family protein [candidate division FCPU426 bacterium]
MGSIKGTDIVALRKLFAEQGQAVEGAFLDGLPPELRSMYQATLYSTWSPVDQQTRLYEKAAESLFPGAPDRMQRLGRAMADKSYSGVYKFFLRIPSIPIVVSLAAKVWGTYFDTGQATAEKTGNQEILFAVKRFPDLPPAMREVISGNICSIMEYAGAKNVRVQHVPDNPQEWRWRIKWE